jgi:hypothetical protein
MATQNGSAQVHIADMKGGDAAQYMQQVAGDMNAQVAGPNGALKYTPVSGGGLEQMAVPALLVLANNVAPKLVKRGGSTMKIGGKRRRGSKHGGFFPEGYVLPSTIPDLEAAIVEQNGVINDTTASKEAKDSAVENIATLEEQIKLLTPPPTGGNMLQQAIVPATLILASNMLGKKGMRKMSSFTKRRSSRRRNNRRKRVSRRFRRGPR